CLECANCCKSISPIVTGQDINRIAKHLKTKPSALIAQYFEIDEDGDYVFRAQPCPFLGADNYCTIYEHRPRACRDYPLTDRIKFYQALDLSVKNTAICPVVFEIFQELQEEF
ncbi:MAG: YkgJ family cysteine cluster protein, partial [Bacteroidota bacterium]